MLHCRALIFEPVSSLLQFIAMTIARRYGSLTHLGGSHLMVILLLGVFKHVRLEGLFLSGGVYTCNQKVVAETAMVRPVSSK